VPRFVTSALAAACALLLGFSPGLDAVARAAAPPPATAAPVRPKATPPAKVRDALKGEALSAFDRASSLFEEGNFSGARAEFARAHTLSGEPRVLYNAAVCDKAMRRYARAITVLVESLSEGGSSLPRAYVDKVHETLALLTPLVTSLDVAVDQEGATVFVDDEEAATTPLAHSLSVEIGEHTVSVRKAGFAESAVRVQAVSGARASVTVSLEPVVKRGELTVRAVGLPAGARATALVDGAEVGDAPWTGEVDAGFHTVTVHARGFVAPIRAQAVGYKARAAIDVPLSAEKHEGRLRILTDSAANAIALDGKPLADGQYDGFVASGEHSVRVSRPGAESYVSEVVVRDDETRSLSIQLSSRSEVPAWVWITGGVVLAGAATVTVVLLTAPTRYEGRSPGTLPPTVVPAVFSFGGP
jgi:hypothetical protein